MPDQPPTPDLQTIAAQLQQEFSQRHDRLLAELQAFTTESSSREQEMLTEVKGIHQAIVSMLEDAKVTGLQRNEAIVKSTQRINRWSIQSAKFVVGSVLLLTLTLIVVGAIAYVSPQDLLDQFRRWLPLIGGAWVTYIGYLIYGIRPSSEGERQAQDEQIATGTNSQSARDPENPP